MKEITEIKKIGKGDRYRLFLDGEFFGTFEAEILARYCLKSGQKFDEEFFEKLTIENGDYACFNRGLSALEKSMKSRKMLRSYLKEKGYPIQCIDRAIEKLESYGYIDDEGYCENYISSYPSKSRRKLKFDLLSKGIKEEIIDEKLRFLTNDEEESEKCLKYGEKYMKNKPIDIKTKQKFYNHLVGKGFSYEDIAHAWEIIEKNNNHQGA